MIDLKSPSQIETMRKASKIVIKTLNKLHRHARAGVRTRELDIVAKDLILSLGGRPAFLGYRGYPCSICTSVNEEIVHGIPGDKVLEEGSLL
ncbi:M24 family metallopeptidase, partial [Candidatus Omnitrophota bacterium]